MPYRKVESPGCSRNFIPSGRQLPRTPPLSDVKKCLRFSETHVDFKSPNDNMEDNKDQDDQNRSHGHSCLIIDDPHCMLKGMKGYQLTESDLEFMKKMKEEQLIKKLQEDLAEMQKQLKKETMALDLAYASRKMALDELIKFPSCEDLTNWATMVLRNKSHLTELQEKDIKTLLTAVTTEDIQNFIDERKEMDQLEKMAAETRNSTDEERRQLEKQIASDELKIKELMEQLVDLKSELLEKQPDELKEPEATNVTSRGQEAKVVKHVSNLQKATFKGKSTRCKHLNNTKDVLKTIPEEKRHLRAPSESRPLKQKPQKVVEDKVSEVSDQAARRRKPAGAVQKEMMSEEKQTKSQQVSHSRKKVAAEEDAEKQPGLGLRRSKRIANRK